MTSHIAEWFDNIETAIINYGHACVELDTERLERRKRWETIDRRDQAVKSIWSEVDALMLSHCEAAICASALRHFALGGNGDLRPELVGGPEYPKGVSEASVRQIYQQLFDKLQRLEGTPPDQYPPNHPAILAHEWGEKDRRLAIAIANIEAL